MGWRIDTESATRIGEELWIDAARAGTIWVPEFVEDAHALALTMALNLLRDRDEITLHIDTCSGGKSAWDGPCPELLWRRDTGKRTIGVVGGQAVSIGLSYLAPCTQRIANPDSEFLVHGETMRHGGARHESGVLLEDHYAADWLARFTKRTYDEWLTTCETGDMMTFGAEQALEWGVIDEIRRVV